ncbi:MAG TPA: SpoIID/LytB domain-containing protein [Gemmatimonadaceae bacterium]|jgi:stage II sporulation protein D|nr:SpoIID/LytB domain-containing protein [Gemmatimonadaceae bacterium]
MIVVASSACTRSVVLPAGRRTTSSSGGEVDRPARGPRDASERVVRILLSARQQQVRLTSNGGWRMYAADGVTLVALPEPGERWVLEREGMVVSARREDSRTVPLRDSPVIVRPTDSGGSISFNGKRWRGELSVSTSEDGLLVVNRARMDDYLRGVVPLEIGTAATADAAAVEAQAVTARSYAVTHLAGARRAYDMTATVQDQVYGGVDAETHVGDLAVAATEGLVLLYGGAVVNAPYHANCGGITAEPQDSWRASSEPFLRRVSDQIPGTDRFYCDQAPRFRWTRTFNGDELRQTIDRYVRSLPGGGGGAGAITNIAVATVTPAGRVATLTVDSDRGHWSLRGNEIRSALRSAGGDLLYSTYFSLEAVPGRSGIGRLTLRGGGNGHGVGMCQSGAIGRARAGQDFRTILRTYYPGTTVGTIQ